MALGGGVSLDCHEKRCNVEVVNEERSPQGVARANRYKWSYK